MGQNRLLTPMIHEWKEGNTVLFEHCYSFLINIAPRGSYVKTFRSVKEFLDSRFLFSISFLLPESSDQIPNLIPNPNSFP